MRHFALHVFSAALASLLQFGSAHAGELTVDAQPGTAISDQSFQSFRFHMTTLAPFRRDHRWIGEIDGRSVNERKFYEASGDADALAQVKRRRRANKMLVWSGFATMLVGTIVQEELRSPGAKMGGAWVGVGGAGLFMTGFLRSFKQATPSATARNAANASNRAQP